MISDNFEPALLRTFVAVCHHRSLTRAAEQAGRAQSALSAQIRRLEEHTGQRLLRRTGRGVVPTKEGEVLLSFAVRILALGEMAVAQLSESTPAGTLRIGMSEDVASSLLPFALGRLRRLCPGLHIELSIESDHILARRWQESAFDIVLGLTAGFSEDPLTSWEIDLHWVCGIDYPWDSALTVDAIVCGEPCSWRRLMFDALIEAGKEFRIAVTSSNLGAIIPAVEGGLGVAMLPAELIRHDSMRLVNVAQAPVKVTYGLFVTRRPNSNVTTALNVIQESLKTLY